MTKQPIVRAAGGIYVMEWTEENLAIRIDRLYEDTHYNVTGEVRVETTAPGNKGHIHQARLNLTSTAARKTLAKHLDEIQSLHTVNWETVVETLCVKILKLYRSGEPAVRLDQVAPRESLKYLVDPLLLAGQANIWFGDGASTKSLLAAFISLLTLENTQVLGLTVQPARPLYLDWEDSVDEIHERIYAMRRGLSINTQTNDFMYRRCTQNLVSDLEAIQSIVIEHRIDFVIVDSAAYACPGDALKQEFVTSYFNALRSLDVTSLTIAHQPKDAKDSNRPFGSNFWHFGGRNIYKVRKTQEPDSDVVQSGMYHTKINAGKLRKPLGFEITFENEGDKLHSLTVSRVDLKQIPELAKGLPLKEQIKGVLHDGAMEVEDIASAIAGKADSVRTVLYRNKKDFAKQGDGTWGLPYEGLPF